MGDLTASEPTAEDASRSWRWSRLRTPVRRVIVVLGLLLTRPAWCGVYYYLHVLSNPLGAGPMKPLAAFALGMGSAVIFPLAVWLVARRTQGRPWRFALRAALYLAAVGYSHALRLNVVESLDRGRLILPLAGWSWSHYSDVPGYLFALFYMALILFPATLLCQCSLVGLGEGAAKKRQFSVRGMLIYTAVIALVVASARWVPADWRTRDAVEWLSGYGVALLPQAAAGMVMLFGLSRSWPTAVALLVVGCAINVGGVWALGAAAEGLGCDMSSNMFGGPLPKMACLALGVALGNWCALAAGRLLGVRPVFGRE